MTDTVGRLMNHAPTSTDTARPFKALLLNSRRRIGFLATKDLEAGEELTWDYNSQPARQKWLYKRQPKPSGQGKYTFTVMLSWL